MGITIRKGFLRRKIKKGADNKGKQYDLELGRI